MPWHWYSELKKLNNKYYNNLKNYKMVICTQCNGQGRWQTIGSFRCSRCAGSGRNCTPGVGMDIFFPCVYCKGTGKVTETRWQFCSSCMGKGRI